MQDLAKTIVSPGIQARIRKAMRHSPSFHVENELPDRLRNALERLDRTTSARERDNEQPARRDR